MYKTSSCTKMFSCVRYCISQYNHKCSCGIGCSNLDTLYYNKDRSTHGGGIIIILAVSSPVTESDTISADFEHDSCLQLHTQTVTCLNYLGGGSERLRMCFTSQKWLEQNVVDRQRSIFFSSRHPKTQQHNAVFLWHKSTRA